MQSDQCTNLKHIRTSSPWLQHRDSSLCHDLSHYLYQTCLINNSAPHTASNPTNARNFIVLVTPFPHCHHHRTTLSFFTIVTRGFVTVPNRPRLDGVPPHPTTELNSTSFSSGAQLVYSFAVSTLVFQFGIVRKTSQALSSRRHSSSRPCGCDCDSIAWIRTSGHRILFPNTPNLDHTVH